MNIFESREPAVEVIEDPPYLENRFGGKVRMAVERQEGSVSAVVQRFDQNGELQETSYDFISEPGIAAARKNNPN